MVDVYEGVEQRVNNYRLRRAFTGNNDDDDGEDEKDNEDDSFARDTTRCRNTSRRGKQLAEDATGVYTRHGCAQLCGRARPAALFSSLPLKQ